MIAARKEELVLRLLCGEDMETEAEADTAGEQPAEE